MECCANWLRKPFKGEISCRNAYREDEGIGRYYRDSADVYLLLGLSCFVRCCNHVHIYTIVIGFSFHYLMTPFRLVCLFCTKLTKVFGSKTGSEGWRLWLALFMAPVLPVEIIVKLFLITKYLSKLNPYQFQEQGKLGFISWSGEVRYLKHWLRSIWSPFSLSALAWEVDHKFPKL